MKLLSNPALRSDHRNPCVPILDVFEDAENALVSYVVTLRLRPLDSPAFETFDDLFHFIEQILNVSIEGVCIVYLMSICV